jgi:predicted transcriptional regulator YdeE
LQIVRGIVTSKGWKVQAVNFIAGTKSMNQKAWNKAMETIGVPKQKWDGTRERFMKVLLDEHETILSSYQAQKYGGGEGSTGKATQG